MSDTESPPPAVAEMVRVFGRIGCLSFGGPAAQIALMHRDLVERRSWLSEDRFLRALSLCMLLPGPEAMQLATYAGWRLRGVAGGLLAGLLFVLPGALVIFALAIAYVRFGAAPLVQAGFVGIKAAVIVIVVEALMRMSRKALVGGLAWAIAALAFIAIFLFAVPFPLIVALAGTWGFAATSGRTRTVAHSAALAPPLGRAWRTVAIWGALWLTPLAVLEVAEGGLLADIGWFMARLAVVTFGGAYAVLGWLTQTVVQDFGWIDTGTMIDALGLAETTPGPLILVTQFVAMLAGHAAGGVLGATMAGTIALWATFVPCFLWIFLAGPYLDLLATRPRLDSALKAVSAAVVGVILNLSLWFALHVLFSRVVVGDGWHRAPVPDFASIDLWAVVLVTGATILLRVLHMPLVIALMAMAAAGVAVELAVG